MIPNTSPLGTSKEMSFNAQTKSPPAVSRSLSLPIVANGSGRPSQRATARSRSCDRVPVPISPKRYCLETSSKRIARAIWISLIVWSSSGGQSWSGGQSGYVHTFILFAEVPGDSGSICIASHVRRNDLSRSQNYDGGRDSANLLRVAPYLYLRLSISVKPQIKQCR